MFESAEKNVNAYLMQQDAEFQRRLEIAGRHRLPYKFLPNASTSHINERYSGLSSGEHQSAGYVLAGRMMAKRKMGKLTFADLHDRTGRIQATLKKDRLGDAYAAFDDIDIGDVVGLECDTVFRTKMGELTVDTTSFTLLSKTLRTMPDKFHGLRDPELRYRQRYLDFLTNRQKMMAALERVTIVDSIRKYLNAAGFYEVETPILQPIYGGANARPFMTHHNALDADLFLRISNELYLKRLIIGGFERVFEFSKDFRNEGIDRNHNPEFTQLEIYQAYADYRDMMDLVETMLRETAQQLGRPCIKFRGNDINMAAPWERISMKDSVKRYGGVDVDTMTDEDLKKYLSRRGAELVEFSRGLALAEMFEMLVEDKLIQPTIVYDYPIEISPLARTHRSDPSLVERFEFYIGGMEIGNAYSELNDPIEQRKRFEHQRQMRETGDEEAHPLDEDFLTAMEYGMPPTGGLGVGVDRVSALLTESDTIREAFLFPMLKNKQQ